MFGWSGLDDTFTAACQTQVDANSPIIQVSCGKLELCWAMNPYCACNATQCSALVSSSDLFDLSFNGDTATGVYGSSAVLFHRTYTTDI